MEFFSVEIVKTDIAIIGAGGAGLRAALAAAQDESVSVALISKVYPMRSHTVAAEGGAAGVVRSDDSLQKHFDDTVSGGDWLCDQNVVRYFVEHATEELVLLERMGCPWSRQNDGNICVRHFGGMKIPRTWFAADRTGFFILHTLYQASTQFHNITRFDEHFVIDLIECDNKISGVLTFDLQNGCFRLIIARAVILATGGAAQAYAFTTNASIVTGDGMALAFRHGVPLRDMEFVQYHPTGLLGCGLLITEAARGEGGVLVNKNGYRYLQDYDLGPETPLGAPVNKTMELGPRDKLSQAFWHEQQKGNTIQTPQGDAVHLDLRHLGEKKLHERLPQICELATAYAGVNPAKQPIPVRAVVHYTMGGIETNLATETNIRGLFAAGECASIGLHGANRLGSNSLAETLVFGKLAGENACAILKDIDFSDENRIQSCAQNALDAAKSKFAPQSTKTSDDSVAAIRRDMVQTMEKNVGIYRDATHMSLAVEQLRVLKNRYAQLRISGRSEHVFDYEFMHLIELGYTLDVAECMAVSALQRKESRGSHQRLDGENAAYSRRNDDDFLKHSRAHFNPNGAPHVDYTDVIITSSKPAERRYGAASPSTDSSHP